MLLVDEAGDISIGDRMDQYPASFILRNGRMVITRLLIDEELISINISDRDGMLPLVLAFRNNHRASCS